MREILDENGSMLVTAAVLGIILAIIALAFSFWLSVQSKATVHKKITAKAEYYGEAGIQKMVEFIQSNPSVQNDLTGDVTTNFFILNLKMPDGTVVEVSAWNLQ